MRWDDLNKKTQDDFLEHCGKVHAEWNNIPLAIAKKRLKRILKDADQMFNVPIIPYEVTWSNTIKRVSFSNTLEVLRN